MASKNLAILDWLRIEGSAPGKFIISGEYSVVYEKPAIATAIDLRTEVTIRPNKEEKVKLNLKNLNSVREWPLTSMSMCRLVTKYSKCLEFDDSMLVSLDLLLHSRYELMKPSNEHQKAADDATIAFLLLYIGLGDSYATSLRPPIDVEVNSAIPVGSGLGSSSAFSVALCGSLMRVFRVSAERYIVSNWAFNIDKFFHGRPSGVDNNIVTHGGHILFQNGKIKANTTAHKASIKVMLIDTGVSRSTKTLGEGVNKRFKEDPTRVTSIFNTINELTNRIWLDIDSPNFVPRNIADPLQANHTLLELLGVGHPKLTEICDKAQRLNLTAKLTGAGGGGSAFVLYDELDNCESINQLRNELISSGFNVHDHKIGCEGLVVKLIPNSDKR